MRRLVFSLTVVLLVVGVSVWQSSATIVNNSGSLATDSVPPMQFTLVDSAGNPGVGLAANDQIYLIVRYPSGAKAFTDTLAYNDGTNLMGDTILGGATYVLKYATSTICGTARNGGYTWRIMVRDSSMHLWNYSRGGFDLYTTADLDALLDKVANCLDSLQAQDGWIAKEASVARDTLLTIRDTLLSKSALDSLQAQDGWIAKEASVARDTLLTIRDTLLSKSALDSLQAQDGWIAKQTTLSADSIYGKNILDSLQAQDGWIAKETSVVRDTLKGDSVIALLNTDIYATLQIFDSLAVWPMYLDLRAWVLDSLPMGFGYPGNTVTASSTLKTNANADTLFLRNGADTTFAIIYYHDGGAANGEPDSTKAIRW
jgi:hypothetical protein